ncbi:MAG: ubiquinol-cytochrome c reductase iron-sulfur subunit [Mycobacterium sp.]
MSDLSRRTILISAAAVPLAACAPNPANVPIAAPPTPGQKIVAAADIPVGSGAIVDGTLVTQPSAGVFKGFIARCTHAGCALSTVKNGAALCPCHGSTFGLDGQVLRGPAMEPLRPRAVSVQGGEIIAG